MKCNSLYTKIVSCETSQIKCKVTREMISDLNMMHSIDVNTELDKILSEEYRKQIRKLRKNKLEELFSKEDLDG